MAEFIEAEPFLAGGIALILLFFVVGLLRENSAKKRLNEQGPAFKHRLYAEFYLTMWALTAAIVLLWFLSGRSAPEIGLVLSKAPVAIGTWVVAGLASSYFVYTAISSVFSQKMRAQIAGQLEQGGDVSMLQPETPWQRRHFYLVSATAGFCEEVVFRGFLIGTFAVMFSLPVAAVLAGLVFILGHTYQGLSGLLRILPITIVLTLMFVLSGSLWPGILLHFVVDAAGGVMLYFAAKSSRASG